MTKIVKDIVTGFARLLWIGRRFERNIKFEIYNLIFPHMRGEENCGYPFKDRAELREQLNVERRAVIAQIELIERTGRELPAAYSEAFRYLTFRDVNQLLSRYRQVANVDRMPETCDPRLVASRS